MIKTICGDIDFIEYLRGKEATFLLSLSYTKTANKNITQAGIDGYYHLTPVLDAEFIALNKLNSLKEIPKTPTGIPSPALITRAIIRLKGFKDIEFLNLGVNKPKINYFNIYDFGINFSGDISIGANIDAKEIFQKGLEFGKEYNIRSDYLILAESIPAGTTTAEATARGLGYDTKGLFASSFSKVVTYKEEVINKALNNINNKDIFDILNKVSDNMLIFNAGFILSFSYRYPVILAGGTQMASLLLLINSIVNSMGGVFEGRVCLATTKWIAEDKNSNIKALLEMLDFDIDAYYSDFDFSLSNFDVLKSYDLGEAKEGVGAGGSLVYGALANLDKKVITEEIEKILKEMV